MNTLQRSTTEDNSTQPESAHSSIPQNHVKGDQDIGSEDFADQHPKEHTYTPTIHKLNPGKSTTSPKNPAGSIFVPKPINADVKADALPVPVPNSEHLSAQSGPTTLVVHPAFIPVGRPTLSTAASGQSTHPTFLPVSASTEDSYAPFPSYPPLKQTQKTPDNHLLVIILASLGGAFLLVILFIIFKIRTRPRPHYHPTPSLPVLQDTFSDRPIAEDSPVFGGKERFSPTLSGDREKWTWTQYHSKPLAKEWRGKKHNRDIFANSEANGASSDDTMLSAQPSQKRPSLLSRSLSRLSALSAYSTSKSEVIGLLTSAPGPSAPTTNSFAERSSYRRSKDRDTIRITIRDWDADDSDSEQFIYGGAEIMPFVVQPPSATLTTGRQRIKAPYPVGSCPSMNSITPYISPSPSIASDPFEDTPFVTTPFVKTEARRERDTKALTAALGLQSPSLTSAGGIVRSRRHLEVEDGRNTIPGSPIDAGMRLGNLMMSDYPAVPLPATRPLRTPGDLSGGSLGTRIVDDKPPRVPSPPLLPSLAQMAMAHRNSLDYDTYHSPTYSLYGIYANTRSIYGDKMDLPSRT